MNATSISINHAFINRKDLHSHDMNQTVCAEGETSNFQGCQGQHGEKG